MISSWQRDNQRHLEFLEKHRLGKAALTLTRVALEVQTSP
jgi:hypothetical protein